MPTPNTRKKLPILSNMKPTLPDLTDTGKNVDSVSIEAQIALKQQEIKLLRSLLPVPQPIKKTPDKTTVLGQLNRAKARVSTLEKQLACLESSC